MQAREISGSSFLRFQVPIFNTPPVDRLAKARAHASSRHAGRLTLLQRVLRPAHKKLRAFLDHYDQPFEPSQLYSPAAEAKYVDTAQRVSEFRVIVNAECFGLAEELVAAVNRNQTGIRFSLVRSDVTEISYQPGGFFKRHQDFLSVQGNVVEEHTMLVCIIDFQWEMQPKWLLGAIWEPKGPREGKRYQK